MSSATTPNAVRRTPIHGSSNLSSQKQQPRQQPSRLGMTRASGGKENENVNARLTSSTPSTPNFRPQGPDRRSLLQPSPTANRSMPSSDVDLAAVLEKVTQMETQLSEARAAGFLTSAAPHDGTHGSAGTGKETNEHRMLSPEDPGEDELEQVQASLAAALQSNAELQKQLEASQACQTRPLDLQEDEEGSIPRPKGTAGEDFSIQVAMGLASSDKKCKIYKGTQRFLRDLAIRSGMNWELPWADIPAGEKGKVYRLARKQHPYLRKYRNDWATEEIIKQFFKNRRKNHYKNGWLTVPERYGHMSDVSSRRDPSGSRTKRAKQVLANARRRRSQREGTSSQGATAVEQQPSGPMDMDDDEDDVVDEREVGDGADDIYA